MAILKASHETVAVADPGAETLDRRLARVAAPGVALALIGAGGSTSEAYRGIASPPDATPVGPETSFLWFSMTKIATATAVMQLVDRGEVELDAPSREYLPAIDALDRRITVRHLLSHSSGIRNPPPLRWIHPAGGEAPDPGRMVARLLRRYGKPRFEPGARASYSNIGYLVLGEIVAAVSGLSYQRYVIERLLRPIGASSTSFAFDGARPATWSRGAHPRRDPLLPLYRLMIPRWAFGERVGGWQTFNRFYLDGSAYGGLVGPLRDAALLASAHLGGGAGGETRLLSTASAAAMQRIATPGRRYDLGLGWFRPHRDSIRGRTYVEHLGGGGGYGSVMRLEPERGEAVVMMANVSLSRLDYEPVLEGLLDGRGP
ncbi:MAG: serine hydrolase domain-containing protein [Syntrophothermus sp.]